MIQQKDITLPAMDKGSHLITDKILKALGELPESGLLHIFIKHTSAALSINENADPTVRHDMDLAFDHLVPENQPFYQHTVEGSDDMPAHIKSVLAGSSISLPISAKKLNLGTWQGIYLMEFRKEASSRSLVLTLIS